MLALKFPSEVMDWFRSYLSSREFHVNVYDKFSISGIVCTAPPLPSLSAGRVEPPTKFSKRGGGLGRTSTLRRGCWKRGGKFFQGGLQFLQKNKLKSEIFNDKKIL